MTGTWALLISISETLYVLYIYLKHMNICMGMEVNPKIVNHPFGDAQVLLMNTSICVTTLCCAMTTRVAIGCICQPLCNKVCSDWMNGKRMKRPTYSPYMDKKYKYTSRVRKDSFIYV